MVIVNGLAAILFMMGYVPLDIAMMRTATLPRGPVCWLRWAPPAHSLGIGIARPVSTIAWPVAIFGVSVSTPASRGPAIGYGACLPPQIDLKADLNNWIAGASVGRYLWPYVRPVAGSSASPRLPKGRTRLAACC